ncbi:40S ribosomal protein S12 [Dimargaris xerosporica]|nr:40S ribosomal protein S12 [Dimargaris xerosporica]
MASEGDVNTVPQEIEVSADASSGPMTVEDAIKDVMRRALIHDGLVRGLRQCCMALDSRQAHVCILSDSCTETEYVKLVEALCKEHSINLIKVSDPKKIGEWAGLCKIDREGNPRKVIGCSCAVIKDWGEESAARNVLLDYFKEH